jgi:hypothetical protein
MLDFKRKPMELKKDIPGAVKNFHDLDLRRVLRIGWAEGGRLKVMKLPFSSEGVRIIQQIQRRPLFLLRLGVFRRFGPFLFYHLSRLSRPIGPLGHPSPHTFV